jgi:tetratricopeptide (TPR) repeat protein
MSRAITRRATAAAILLLVGASAPASGAALSAGCNDLARTALLPEVIAACTADLETGGLQGRELAEAYRRRGVAHARSRQFSEAVGDLDHALAIQPNWPEALADKGRALIQLGSILRPATVSGRRWR